ncbi:hypothetical protein PF002_g16689 [Phytophthora fragariae]|nr:hypothetical protein PF002_g16689 [Phytophthora fragariae]
MLLVIPTRKVTPSLSAVHPVDPSTKENGPCLGPDINIVSFYDAFGVLGVPMLLTLLTCSAWTTWLIVAALAPNETANWLMSTGAYNNGQFWLISDKTRVSSSLARLVLLSLMLATSYHSRRDDTWLRSKRKFSNVSSKALNLAMQVLPVVLLHLLESGAPEQRSSSAQSSTGL